MLWAWTLIFVINALLDVVWARYTMAIQARQAHTAGLWAVGIILFAGASIIFYTADHWLLIPAAIGAYVGTWITVAIARRNQ